MMKGETKAAIRTRLLADGRWEEFIRHREALKAAGESIEEAWQKAAAEFPPLQEGETAKRPMVPIRFENKEQSRTANFDWAAEALGEFRATGKLPMICPNRAAWGVFDFAKNNPREFYQSYLRLDRKRDDDEGSIVKHARLEIEQLDIRIAEVRDAVVQQGAEGSARQPQVAS